MSIQGKRWSGLTRVLAVLGVVAGVFAMHGLTGNHDAAMLGAQTGASMSSTSADRPMSPSHAAPVVEHQRGIAVLVSVLPLQEFVPADDAHAMAGACMAVLNGLILLLTLLLGLRSLLAWHPARLAAIPVRPALTGLSPPWLAPSLSKLCVSRT
jgi:hypothetical protein